MTDRLSRAYAACEALARAHYENFPVASRLLPAAMRPHIAAIYAFARKADDFADEPGRPPAERLRLLDDWRLRLAGRASQSASEEQDDLIFEALENTIVQHRLPRSLFEDLLSAFRQDITTTRYATWQDLLEYCRRSANPVGRLVLRVAGVSTRPMDEASDAVCTALQLTNFWQDLAIDWRSGRLYVPTALVQQHGARESDLDAGVMSPAWQEVLAAAAERTRSLFAAGRPVCDAGHGRLRWELRLTWLGGNRILDTLAAARYDVFRHRPALAAREMPLLAWRALRWGATPGK